MRHPDKRNTLRALSRTDDESAQQILLDEHSRISKILASSDDFIELDNALDLLDEFVFRVSASAWSDLIQFFGRLGDIDLRFSSDDRLSTLVRDFDGATTLRIKAIEVLLRLKYICTNEVAHFLLQITAHRSDKIRSAATSGLREIARLDFEVMRQISVQPQQLLINLLREMSDSDILIRLKSICDFLPKIIEPQVQSTDANSTSISITTRSLPVNETTRSIRKETIDILKRLYGLAESSGEKLQILKSWTVATQTPYSQAYGEDLEDVIAENTLDLLEFLKSLVTESELSIVEYVEDKAHFEYRRNLAGARDVGRRVTNAAIELHTMIEGNSEYQIYRCLVGDNNIYGEWTDQPHNGLSYDETETVRKTKAREFAESITQENYDEWRLRIIDYCEKLSGKSSMAGTFFDFLALLGELNPDHAIRLIGNDAEAVRIGLVALLRGVLDSPSKSDVRAIMSTWTQSGEFLCEISRTYWTGGFGEIETLISILDKATEIEDVDATESLIAVAVSNYEFNQLRMKSEILLPAISFLTSCKTADWIYGVWFQDQVKLVLDDMVESDIDVVLNNLVWVATLDYHAEKILFHIARRFTAAVIEFFRDRIEFNLTGDGQSLENYRPIPFDLHELTGAFVGNEEASMPILRSMFVGVEPNSKYLVASLVQVIYPTVSQEMQSVFLEWLDDPTDETIEFIVSVLQEYNGENFVYPVCRRIVALSDSVNVELNGIRSALWQTPVVSGEYGLANAYSEKIERIRPWHDDESREVREFAARFTEDMNQLVESERQRADEEIAVRKFNYGEPAFD